MQQLWPHAEPVARRLGIEPAAIIAQSALETGWGQHIPGRPDGTSSRNLFGIKAGSTWAGERVAKTTLEFENGVATQQRQSFRAYDSFAQSFEDFAELVAGNERYREALDSAREPKRFFAALQKAGYATDPHYAQKVLSVLSGETMRAALAGARPEPMPSST